jgi:hypothetical protein
MAKTAKKTDPELWEKIKTKVKEGSKGGKPGQWSARKAQLAVQRYEKKGGGFEGQKPDDTSLGRWQDEEWGTRSGEKSGETGERYLPKEAREGLTDEEYKMTSDKKRSDTRKGKQFSGQPEKVKKKVSRTRRKARAEKKAAEEKTKGELHDEATEAGVEGPSSMSKDGLKKSVDQLRNR